MKIYLILQKVNNKRMAWQYWLARHCYYLYFIFHSLRNFHFDLKYCKDNGLLIVKLRDNEWLDATKRGHLVTLSDPKSKVWFFLKNVLTLGAVAARVERVIEATFLVYSLEVNNPFSKKVLLQFLKQKEIFLSGLINRNLGSPRLQASMRDNLDHYMRASYLQLRIIEKMHRAVKGQKRTRLVERGTLAIAFGMKPQLSAAGLSGSYLILGEKHELLGIFKPFDEEMGAPNNPTGSIFQGALGQRRVRRGCRSGESAHHEVGAYLVDHYLGFGLVPPTYYASFSSNLFFCNREDRSQNLSMKTKYGSFQEFYSGCSPITEVTNEQLQAIDRIEYQMLLILDVIIGNQDRIFTNFLIKGRSLVAIDHGLAFPDRVTGALPTWWWNSKLVGYQLFDSSLVDLLKFFPFNELSWKLQKRCMIESGSISRMQERVTLFSEGVYAGLLPYRLAELMQEKYLFPLVGLKSTLSFKAKEMVQKYISSLKV